MHSPNFKHLKTILSSALVILTLAAPITAAANIDGDDSSSRSFLFFGKKKNKKSKNNSESDSVNSSDKYTDLTASGSSKISKGVFNVIRKGDDFYFEIPAKHLDKAMLVVNKLLRVPSELNDAGVNRGTNYSNDLVKFQLDKKAGKVLVRQFRPLPDVDPEDNLASSVEENYISPIIASFKVEAYNNDSTSVVIKVNDIYNGSANSFNNVFDHINLDTPTKSDLSKISSIKAFENNVYAVSELTTKVTEPGGSVFVTVEVGSTLLLLPDTPMPRRYASPRVGYFTESSLQYSGSQQRVPRRHYITRWRLEPKPEETEAYLAGQIVEPQKPIIFWLDKTTPKKWCKYLRQGIEDWNSAFELAGFKNAIRVEQIPDSCDIDRDDINYSVLNYAASRKSNAMGPSITDPRSGEILEADIMWWHNVLDILHDWIVIQTAAIDPNAQTFDLPEELIGDAMRFVACHEVGHSLGLRHNMIASAAIPTEKLRDPKYIEELGGTSASIMDYARFNYVAQPGDGVKTLSPHIGPYDRLAIEYGYRWYGPQTSEEEYDLLQELLDNHDTPLYRYADAQDSRSAIDPRALSEDLGDDPVAAAKYGIANLKRIVPNIIKWTSNGKRGQDYDDASRLYYSAVNQWNMYVYHVLANIGGIYVDNTTVTDGRPTYRFVETPRQREALQFIIDEALTQPSWLFDADVSNYTFLVRNTPQGRQENSPNFILKNAQSFLLWDLLDDNRIIRMYENEAMNGKNAFSTAEMMDMLHKGIFGITEKGKPTNVRERSVQKNFVDALIIAANETRGVKEGAKSAIGPDADRSLLPLSNPSERGCFDDFHFDTPSGFGDLNQSSDFIGEHAPGRRYLNFYGSQGNRVSDAISVKRGELMRIRTLLIARMNSANRDDRYHYSDLVMRINTALGITQLQN